MGTKKGIDFVDIEYIDGKEVTYNGELIGLMSKSCYSCEVFYSIALSQKQVDDIDKMSGYFIEDSKEKGKLYISIIIVDKDYSKLAILGEKLLKVL